MLNLKLDNATGLQFPPTYSAPPPFGISIKEASNKVRSHAVFFENLELDH